ncbi:hypothetical protein PC129_g6655 [Phytophthora cactorum]|uniref:Uncharacterized protein n=1 Tax=Phytophthora cactorum TaxID=29920 RepID=A0A8T1CZ85_9STRA|nr:hypothetical protein Pcac1_g7600 [Phytophthora cactorum]KAG2830197.1 hypothetical protein PC111_g7464 [Phytophthora cactorum]KAG2832609.1 hypothetical protein PC112_g6825 [Phytophthora cactorum]KAG2859487.1 hypothetical protein PC113_g8895 [Phytophthora cactorum]KAG2911622.1 hypothetical protein PC114_g9298 [Phytophthora cactorum]
MDAEFVPRMLELLEELGIATQAPMVLHVDNQAAIKQMEGEDSSGKARHIDVCLKFIIDFVSKNVIALKYCESRVPTY